MLRDEATFALATREIFGPFQIITSYTDDQLPLGNTHTYTHFDNHTNAHTKRAHVLAKRGKQGSLQLTPRLLYRVMRS